MRAAGRFQFEICKHDTPGLCKLACVRQLAQRIDGLRENELGLPAANACPFCAAPEALALAGAALPDDQQRFPQIMSFSEKTVEAANDLERVHAWVPQKNVHLLQRVIGQRLVEIPRPSVLRPVAVDLVHESAALLVFDDPRLKRRLHANYGALQRRDVQPVFLASLVLRQLELDVGHIGLESVEAPCQYCVQSLFEGHVQTVQILLLLVVGAFLRIAPRG